MFQILQQSSSQSIICNYQHELSAGMGRFQGCSPRLLHVPFLPYIIALSIVSIMSIGRAFFFQRAQHFVKTLAPSQPLSPIGMKFPKEPFLCNFTRFLGSYCLTHEITRHSEVAAGNACISADCDVIKQYSIESCSGRSLFHGRCFLRAAILSKRLLSSTKRRNVYFLFFSCTRHLDSSV